MKNYQSLARAVDYWLRVHSSDTRNEYWEAAAQERIAALEKNLPSGSGFDSGTSIDLSASRLDRIVLETAFHHMDDNGGYCEWSHHSVIVKPSLQRGFDIRVTGRNMRDTKEYIADTFRYWLDSDSEDY